MSKHAHGEKIRRHEGLKGQRWGFRERQETLKIAEEALKGNEKVLWDNE